MKQLVLEKKANAVVPSVDHSRSKPADSVPPSTQKPTPKLSLVADDDDEDEDEDEDDDKDAKVREPSSAPSTGAAADATADDDLEATDDLPPGFFDSAVSSR